MSEREHAADKDRESRAIQREMAAEWLRLADAIAHPLKPTNLRDAPDTAKAIA